MNEPHNPAAAPGTEFFRYDPADELLRLPDGTAITDEVAHELARAAERTGPPRGLIPGGKSLSGGRRHSPQITVVLSEETDAALRAQATSERMSVSRWTRRLIERELARG